MDKTVSMVFFYSIIEKYLCKFKFKWNIFQEMKIEINIQKGDEKNRYKRNS